MDASVDMEMLQRLARLHGWLLLSGSVPYLEAELAVLLQVG